MHWDRFATGLKHLIAKVASPENLAPEDDPAADTAIPRDPFGNDGYCEERVEPYSPDYRTERSDSSLHLSC
ncbi:hypothetical protein GGD83_002034 [Rhodoblastus sphagnicola]|uniref:hypothetical protein n=1 Tax=Rhodoblastus sphagnicola TaxID=333368 RepID=UPI0011B06AE7|nr:hypothetical protein [Rhodoblastus sphagnicola]MBB4198234.1 hypothetical protein [Rhodoblastus sphagnicola]